MDCILFDDRIREQIVAYRFQFRFTRSRLKIQLQELPDTHVVDSLQPGVLQGVSYRHPLRIQYALFWHYDNPHFHQNTHHRETAGLPQVKIYPWFERSSKTPDWTPHPQLVNFGNMPPLRKWLALNVIALGSVLSAFAAEQPPANSTNADAPLSADEIKSAVSVDALTVPTPGEFFQAIEKQGKPNWASQYRPPISINSTNRAQIALNLGTLIADGYIAVEAHDGQQVKNIGKDVLALAKRLSVSQSVLSRSASITDFAENNQWDQLNEELEETQNEVKKALDENRDTDLITLVSIGGWVRGTEVVTGILLQSYNAEDAKLLRQPALVSFLKGKLATLPEKMQKDILVQNLNRQLDEIQKMVSFSPDHVPTQDEIRDLNLAASKLTKEIGAPE